MQDLITAVPMNRREAVRELERLSAITHGTLDEFVTPWVRVSRLDSSGSVICAYEGAAGQLRHACQYDGGLRVDLIDRASGTVIEPPSTNTAA